MVDRHFGVDSCDEECEGGRLCHQYGSLENRFQEKLALRVEELLEKKCCMCAKYIVRGRRDTTQTVLNIKRAQGSCPWRPPQEGARGQSSSARRGLPSKGEARALHHQPAPALTLTTPCSLLSIARRGGETPENTTGSLG